MLAARHSLAGARQRLASPAVWSPPTAVCQGAFAESSLQGARRYARLATPCLTAPPAANASRHATKAFTSSAVVAAKEAVAPVKKEKLDMAAFPLDRIRNLSIIAHIDHGKSTLADRLLQLTGTLPASSNPQFLDKLKVERERGITVKAQTVSLIHRHTDGHEYLINLIDTPGHVDFSYEVSRSLGACEGGLLLVDCSQGIQAQTLSVYHHAVDADLTLLPVINKVDLPHADPAAASKEIASSLGLPEETHMRISAKSGLGVESVLDNIVDNLPAPDEWAGGDKRLRGLVFDTFYDHFRGVVSLVRLFSGSVKKGDKVKFLQAGKKYEVLEVGVYNPEEVPVDELYPGQVGYVVCNMKNSDEAHIGDTICYADKPVDALPGFKPMKAMVYAGVFPVDSNEFTRLEEAIERLTLNDRSVSVQRESSAALSQGFRLGFLGTLHMDVFRQRLEDEYESSVIITSPTVPFKVVYKDGREEFISNPAEFPDTTDPKMRVAHIEEPMVNATIFVPNEYIGQMMTLCSKYRGQQVEYKVLDASERAVLRYTLPLSEIVTDFFSELKSESSGFASFDYEEAGYEQSDLVKLNMMLNSKPVDALAMIVHRGAAQSIGRVWTKKLRSVLPRQLFEVAIQAAVGTKVLARETLSAMRKDVTAGLYGGHYERKMKHLEKQKKGKLRLKKLAGNIDVPQSAFFEVLSSRPRGYATSARHTGSYTSAPTDAAGSDAVVLSAIAQLLGPPPPAQTTVSAHVPEPILPPDLHPQTRSVMLSNILRLADSPTATASSIYSAWTRLYLLSPDNHIFSPVELATVLFALHRAQAKEKTPRVVARERFGIVADELRAARAGAPERQRQTERFQGMGTVDTMIATLAQTPTDWQPWVRASRMTDRWVEAQDERLTKMYPGPPPEQGKRAYDLLTSGFLSIVAKKGFEAMFAKWWQRRIDAGIRPDSYAVLSRMTLYAKLGRVDDMKRLWTVVIQATEKRPSEQQGLDTGDKAKVDPSWPLPMGDKDGEVLLNVLIWHLAKAEHWADVAGIYDRLRRQGQIGPFERMAMRKKRRRWLGRGMGKVFFEPSAFAGAEPNTSIPVPLYLTASTETYSLLIHAAAHQGDLPGALDVMRHMFGADLVPGVQDYCALFTGFARWGRIGAVDKGDGRGSRWLGELDDHFPTPFSFDAEAHAAKQARDKQVEGRIGLANIWSRTKDGHDPSRARAGRVRNDENNPWTYETLNVLFDTFMSLHAAPPGRRLAEMEYGSTAPSPKQLWRILLAFNRASAGDRRVVQDIWAQLESKFGSSHTQGGAEAVWHGWRLDKRLQRLLSTFEQSS